MKKYPRLTLEEHRRFGRDLKEFKKKVWSVMANYPKSSFEGDRLLGLEEKIDLIRSVMDDAVSKEHGHLEHVDLSSIYYPSDVPRPREL